MRDSSFDELARGLASGSISRGKAIRLMGAALLGGTLASMPGVALADDECKRTGKKCKKNKQCCSGNCSGGTCRPTGTGPNLVTCGCPDGTSVDACDSFDCSSPQPFFALCSSLCASHGGLPVSFLGCGASAVCQPPV
jgi:hypothetical protein